MKNYEEFKTSLAEEMLHYLPERFQNYRLRTDHVPKINGFLESLSIMPPDGNCAVPTLYVSDLYEYYLGCGSMEAALCKAAEVYLSGLDYLETAPPQIDLAENPLQIVYHLVGTLRNQALIKTAPNRPFMDMTLIYRLMREDPRGGFNSAIITGEIMESLGMTESQLYEKAAKNTPLLLPLRIQRMDDVFYCMSNRYYALGAASILYDGALRRAASMADDDLYILPSSVHEVFLVAAGSCDLDILAQTVRDANQEILKPEEILTDSVYRYNRFSDQVTMAAGSGIS